MPSITTVGHVKEGLWPTPPVGERLSWAITMLSVRPDASWTSWTFVFRGEGFCLWTPDQRSMITTGRYTLYTVSTDVCGRFGLCQPACYAKKNRAQGIGRRRWCLKYSIEKTRMLWGWGGTDTKVGVFTCIMCINSDLGCHFKNAYKIIFTLGN